MFKFFALFLLASVCLATQKARFDSYKVYRVQAGTRDQFNLLHEIENGNSYNFWDSPKAIGDFADIMVPPHKFDEIEEIITRFGLKSSIIIENLQSLVDKEVIGGRDDPLDWTAYHPLETIYKWIAEKSLEYPGVVTTFEIGKSYERRPILGMKISYKEGNEAVFIESNIHARYF